MICSPASGDDAHGIVGGTLGGIYRPGMKYFVWIMSAVNVYFGLRSFLNAIHVLQTSKYSQTTTVIFAVLFLGLGVAGFYFSIVRNNPKLGLFIAFGPWVLAIVVLFFTMISSNYQ